MNDNAPRCGRPTDLGRPCRRLLMVFGPRLICPAHPTEPAPCAGWRAWGDTCVVCHLEVPEGQAVAYPYLLGSRACIGDCSDHVTGLLKVYDRSARGRWRPTRQVHDLANGARCRNCRKGAA